MSDMKINDINGAERISNSLVEAIKFIVDDRLRELDLIKDVDPQDPNTPVPDPVDP